MKNYWVVNMKKEKSKALVYTFNPDSNGNTLMVCRYPFEHGGKKAKKVRGEHLYYLLVNQNEIT